jgi:hypothetical protein
MLVTFSLVASCRGAGSSAIAGILDACYDPWNVLMTKAEVIASIGTRDWAQVKTSGGWCPTPNNRQSPRLRMPEVAFIAGNGGGLGVSFKKVRAPLV